MQFNYINGQPQGAWQKASWPACPHAHEHSHTLARVRLLLQLTHLSPAKPHCSFALNCDEHILLNHAAQTQYNKGLPLCRKTTNLKPQKTSRFKLSQRIVTHSISLKQTFLTFFPSSQICRLVFLQTKKCCMKVCKNSL